MAWEQSYSRFGADFEKCYWRLTGLQLDFQHKTAQLTFHAYCDEASANDPVMEAISSRCVVLTGGEFDSWSKVAEFKTDAYEFSANAAEFTGAKQV